jgi:hypothetical protein
MGKESTPCGDPTNNNACPKHHVMTPPPHPHLFSLSLSPSPSLPPSHPPTPLSVVLRNTLTREPTPAPRTTAHDFQTIMRCDYIYACELAHFDLWWCVLSQRFRNGTLVSRDDPHYPFDAYLGYCCPCDTCHKCGDGVACCDPFSSTNGKSIYQLGPSREWTRWGFPVNSSDGWIGHPKMHELNVGGLLTQLVFACPVSAQPWHTDVRKKLLVDGLGALQIDRPNRRGVSFNIPIVRRDEPVKLSRRHVHPVVRHVFVPSVL